MDRSRQILNVVSELQRANAWHGRNDQNLRLSLERALELLDFCSDDRAQWHGNRLRELRRLREALAAFYIDSAHRVDLSNIIRAAVLLDAGAAAMLPRDTPVKRSG